MRDVFRPPHDPAQAIYDTFQAEAEKRKNRSFDEWIAAERQAVHNKALEMASKMGLRAPSLEEVEKAETYAMGHVDYGAQWAHRLTDFMHQNQETS